MNPNKTKEKGELDGYTWWQRGWNYMIFKDLFQPKLSYDPVIDSVIL